MLEDMGYVSSVQEDGLQPDAFSRQRLLRKHRNVTGGSGNVQPCDGFEPPPYRHLAQQIRHGLRASETAVDHLQVLQRIFNFARSAGIAIQEFGDHHALHSC